MMLDMLRSKTYITSIVTKATVSFVIIYFKSKPCSRYYQAKIAYSEVAIQLRNLPRTGNGHDIIRIKLSTVDISGAEFYWRFWENRNIGEWPEVALRPPRGQNPFIWLIFRTIELAFVIDGVLRNEYNSDCSRERQMKHSLFYTLRRSQIK